MSHSQPDCAPPPTREELCKIMFDAADHDFGDQEEAFGAAVARMATAILAAIAAPQGAQPDSEPVAWRWRFENENRWTLRSSFPSIANDADVICEPLYAAPQG